jgi:hypothetical protein
MNEQNPFEPRIVWSEETRAQVLPRRDSEPAPVPLEIDGPALRAEIQAQYDDAAPRLKNGVPRSAASCTPIMREIIAHFSAGEPRPELSVDAAAGAMVVLTYGWLGAQDACLRCFLHERALPFAVRALCRSFDLHAEGDLRDPAARFLFRTADAARFKRPWEVGRLAEEKVHKLVEALSTLRRAVAAADDGTYAETRAVVEPVIGAAGTPVAYRCALAFLFPTEDAWVRAAAEACVAAGKPEESYYARHLDLALAAVADPELAARLARLMEQVPDEALVLTMIDRVGPAAVGALRALSHNQGLMLIRSVEAIQALAPMLGQKAVMEHLHHTPELSIFALAADPGRESGGQAVAVSTLAAAHPEAARSAMEKLDPAGAAFVKRVLGPEASELASPEQLPGVLAAPPWFRKKKEKKKKAKAIPGVAMLEHPESIAWAEGERERLLAEHARHNERRKRSPEQDQEIVAKLEKKPGWGGWPIGWIDQIVNVELAAEIWETYPTDHWSVNDYYRHHYGRVFLALMDTRCLPGFIKFYGRDPGYVVEHLAIVDSARLAPIMADAFSRLKKCRATAGAWLSRFPEAAAVGLIPDAVGKAGKARDAAEAALRHLSGEGQRQMVEGVARRYDEAVHAEVSAILDVDPLELYPAKLPKLPPFFNPRAYPRPVLREGGKKLPDDAIEQLATMLAFCKGEPVYPGIDQVKQACEPGSLRDFAWGLFSAWLAMDGAAKQNWAMHALGHFGDDEVARRLTPMIRRWPGESASARAVEALSILARIGTDVALMHLHGISQKVKFASIKKRATEMIEQIAEDRGLTRDQLADRLVPDLDLDPDGSLLLDYGPRRFRVGFDEQLRPNVSDESGKQLKNLPKPGKKDDEALARPAEKRFKALTKDVKTIAGQQIERLEQAMVARRRWTPAEFKQFFVDHPLLIHLVRRLVWGAFDSDRLSSTFRVAEDRSLADMEDNPLSLPAGVQVGIPHRLELGPALAETWGPVLADYDLVQPFPQLARPVFALEAAEREADCLTRHQHVKLPAPTLVFGLERLRWARYDIIDGGGFNSHYKEFEAADTTAIVYYDGAVGMGYIEASEICQLTTLHFQRTGGTAMKPGEADPIVVSEALRDLDELAAKAD